MNELKATPEGQPGAGGAHVSYRITGFAHPGPGDTLVPYDAAVELLFQNGPIPEVGINGLTNEVLLEVVRHRLQGFQSGRFACIENGLALTNIVSAIAWLNRRTADRTKRGVEGTHHE